MVLRALFWFLLPFTLPQALHLRKNAPRFKDAQGPKKDTVGAGPDMRMLAIGDSIIAGVGAPTLEQALVGQTAEALAKQTNRTVRWTMLGRTGANLETAERRLFPKLAKPPYDQPYDAIIVSMGVNDVTALRRTRDWRTRLRAFLTTLSEHSPNAVIALAGLPPLHIFPLLPQPLRFVIGLRGRTFDRIAQDVCSTLPNVVHVPVQFEPGPSRFSEDGYHPSVESYREFGQGMSEALIHQINAKI